MAETPESIVAHTARLNQKIFAVEDKAVLETTALIGIVGALQKAMQMPVKTKILTDSLHYLMQAQSTEELSVYRESFFAALEKMQLPDVLEVDACVDTLRKCADDLFYLNNSHLSLPTQQQMIEQQAVQAAQKFAQQVDKLQHEFEAQIDRNKLQIEQLKAQLETDYFSQQEKITQLTELNTKYAAGIERVRSQKNLVAKTLETIKTIPNLKTQAERQHARVDFALALHDLRLLDARTGFKHFVNQCKVQVNSLHQIRSTYLHPEESILKPMAKAAWIVGKSFIPSAVRTRILELPEEFPSFALDAVAAGVDEAYVKAQLGQRNPPARPRPTSLEVAGDYAKKTLTVALGVGSLILAGLMCLTGVGIPKGLVIAHTAMGMLNTVKDGSDFFTEHAKKIKRNKTVIQNLEALEQQHDALDVLIEPSEKKTVKQATDEPVLSSEAKIELLLMGHKPGEAVSKAELEQFSHPQVTEVEEDLSKPASEAASKNDLSDSVTKLIQQIQQDNEEESEGEGKTKPAPPHLS